jgi:Cu2+-exporting ATPase
MGVFTPILNFELSPMFGALAMSLSSVFVVSNALRLNSVKLKSTKRNIKKKNEDFQMVKILKIEGIMCSHCEARVKAALEELPFVSSAEVRHESGTARVTLTSEDDASLEKAVVGAGYKLILIETEN